MAKSLDPGSDAVCSGSTLFASILNKSVILGNYFQQTTSADDIFGCIFSRRFKGLITIHYPISFRHFSSHVSPCYFIWLNMHLLDDRLQLQFRQVKGRLIKVLKVFFKTFFQCLSLLRKKIDYSGLLVKTNLLYTYRRSCIFKKNYYHVIGVL